MESKRPCQATVVAIKIYRLIRSVAGVGLILAAMRATLGACRCVAAQSAPSVARMAATVNSHGIFT